MYKRQPVNGASGVGQLDFAAGVVSRRRAAVAVVVVEGDAGVVALDLSLIHISNHTVDKNFQVDAAVLAEFKKYLASQNIPFTEADLNGVMDWLKISICLLYTSRCV